MSNANNNLFHAISFLQMQGISQATQENFYALQIINQRVSHLYEAISNVVTVDDTKAAMDLRDGFKKVFNNAADIPLDELTILTKEHYKAVNEDLATMRGLNEAKKKTIFTCKIEQGICAVVALGAAAAMDKGNLALPFFISAAAGANCWWASRKIKSESAKKTYGDEDFKEARDQKFIGFVEKLVERYELKPHLQQA